MKMKPLFCPSTYPISHEMPSFRRVGGDGAYGTLSEIIYDVPEGSGGNLTRTL